MNGPLAPKPPNADGNAIVHVRWMVETPAGWLGAWDRSAFDAYISAAVAAERERIAQEFDRRDAGVGGFYDPHEPAEIIRAMGAP